jgi:hypothetical protein
MAVPFTLALLRAELINDPAGLNYNALGQNDTDMAEKINRRRNAFQIARTDVSGQEILEAIALSDCKPATTVVQAAWFESFTQVVGGIRLLKDDLTNGRVITNLLDILVNASASETRVKALGKRDASRAENLWGDGSGSGNGLVISVGTISEALTPRP